MHSLEPALVILNGPNPLPEIAAVAAAPTPYEFVGVIVTVGGCV